MAHTDDLDIFPPNLYVGGRVPNPIVVLLTPYTMAQNKCIDVIKVVKLEPSF